MAFVSRGANNFIKQIIVHDCARPWFIYIETFIPAFLKLVFTVTLLDPEDILRARATRLSNTPGKGPHRKKRPRLKGRVQVSEPISSRYTRGALKTVLYLTEPLEKIGFAWLLYAATDQFFMDWQTLIERSDYCNRPASTGPLTRSRGPGQISILSSGAAVNLHTPGQDRAAWNSGNFGFDGPEGVFSGIFALTVTGPTGGIVGVRLRIIYTGLLGQTSVESEPVNIAEDEVTDLIWSGTFGTFPTPFSFVGWEIVGPTVPVGLFCTKGMCAFQLVG